MEVGGDRRAQRVHLRDAGFAIWWSVVPRGPQDRVVQILCVRRLRASSTSVTFNLHLKGRI